MRWSFELVQLATKAYINLSNELYYFCLIFKVNVSINIMKL